MSAGPRTTSAPSSRASTSCARRARRGLLDRALRAPRRRDSLRLSGWPKVERVLAGDRRRRAARHRSGRRRSRSLAACPQPPRRRRRAAPLHAATSIAPGFCAGGSTHDALRLRHDDVFRRARHRRYRRSSIRLPRLIWNASASVPIGLYAVHPAGALHVTELRRGAAARSRSRASSTSAAICPRACRC